MNISVGTGLFLAVALFFGIGVSLTHAQQVGIKLKPSIIEERVLPGQNYPFELRVTNEGSGTETFYFTKRDISGIGDDGHPILSDNAEEKTDFEASTWISIEQESITLSAGQQSTIPITIRVPSDATSGGHFASILVTTNPPQLQGVGATVAYGASTIVALRVGGTDGEVIEEGDIREFRTDKILYGKPEVTFIAKVANTGNAIIRPRGPLEITDMFGKKIASLVVNPDAGAVLPNGARTFETNWKGEGVFFGRYQVVMSLGFGEDEKRTVSETLSFWILPSNIIIPTLVFIAGLIVALFVLTKLHIRRNLSDMGATTGQDSRFIGRTRRGAPASRLLLVTAVLLAVTLVFFLAIFVFLA